MPARIWDRRSVVAGAAAAGGLYVTIARAAIPDPIGRTRQGMARGNRDGAVAVFKGVPYGAPTGGADRFAPPRPPTAWAGVRDCTAFGDASPQLPSPGSTVRPRASEDCLTLNIWTPDPAHGAARPVMVWVHGGGFSVGSGASPITDGARLAERGDVVVVTLNHRLNVFGYLYLGEFGPGYAAWANAGQQDIVAALRWVRDNIRAFGGDPGNVTLFGQSGGGSKVAAVLAMPSAGGLVHRAALQSGFGVTAASPAEADAMTRRIMQAAGVRPGDVGALQALSAERLLDALETVGQGDPTVGPAPVADGMVLPRAAFTPAAPPATRRIPVIVGHTRTEVTGLFPPAGAFDLDWQGLRTLLSMSNPTADIDRLVSGFRQLSPQASPSDLYFRIETERGMGRNANIVAERKAQQGGAPVFAYLLDWRTPVQGGRLRTPHGLDIPMVFDTLAKASNQIGPVTRQAQAVADDMSEAWLAFARTGDPSRTVRPWPAFDLERRSTMVFDTASHVASDPVGQERRLLAAAGI